MDGGYAIDRIIFKKNQPDETTDDGMPSAPYFSSIV
jgi:hypothetical protein